MRAGRGVVAGVVVAAWVATPALAHRLDEYLQATTIDLKPGSVLVEVRLTPGVAVLGSVLAEVDRDADGVISDEEQRAYAGRVLGDLSLTVDGARAALWLRSATFAEVGLMKEGMGEIRLEFEAEVGEGGTQRRLVFENWHRRDVGAYLANCLVPGDAGIRVTRQRRNFDQTVYEMDYVQAGVRGGNVAPGAEGAGGWWVGVDLVVVGGWVGLVWLRRRARMRQALDGSEMSSKPGR